MNVLRVLYHGRATVLRKHANTTRLSGEKIKLSYIPGKVVRHSHECPAAVVRHSRVYRVTVARYIFKIRPKLATLWHKCPFNETAT